MLGDDATLVQMLMHLISLAAPYYPVQAPRLLVRAAAHGHLRLCQYLCALGTPVAVLSVQRLLWEDPVSWPAERLAAFHGWLARVQHWSAFLIAVDAGFTELAQFHLRFGQALYSINSADLQGALRRDAYMGQLQVLPPALHALCHRCALPGWRPDNHVWHARELRTQAFHLLLAFRTARLHRQHSALTAGGVPEMQVALTVLSLLAGWQRASAQARFSQQRLIAAQMLSDGRAYDAAFDWLSWAAIDVIC